MRVDKIFDEYGIPYNTAGSPNTSPGWISIKCPYCNDRSNHLGINLSSGKFSCFRCQEVPKATQCIMDILGVGFETAKKLLDKHQVTRRRPGKEDAVVKTNNKVIFPTGCTRELMPAHRNYLESRGFDPDKVAKEYDMMATGKNCYLGKMDYSKRIIFPIYYNKELVSWQSRDVTGTQDKIKYKACAKDYEKINHQHIFFSNKNYDGRIAIVCEGVLDAIRIGKMAIATFGIGVTRQQLRSISENFDTVYILYDPEYNAQLEAKKLVRELSFRGVVARNIDMKDWSDASDPGEMSQKDIEELIRYIK